MDSLMKELEIEWEIYVEYDLYGNCYPYIVSAQNGWIDPKVRDWMIGDVLGNYKPHIEERWPMVEYTTTRTITFEVEVHYTEEGGRRKARTATCQNSDPPNYVKAFLEQQAMKEFDVNPLPVKKEIV